MRKIIIASVALSVLALALAILLPLKSAGRSRSSAETPPPDPPPPIEELMPPGSRADKEVLVRVLDGETVLNMTMEQFLIGVVAAEMPAAFELEALKAQAVAARTDTLYHMHITPAARHPEADICTDFACCMAYNSDELLRERWGRDYLTYITKVISAVTETDAMFMKYEEMPILAVFHSSSSGRTEDSENVWGNSVPYLKSVESPENEESVPGFMSTVTVAVSDFLDTFSGSYPEAVFGDDAGEWIKNVEYNENGRVSTVIIGEVLISGTQLRALFGLRSTALTIELVDENVVFATKGYGHGVGMSQYGANALAKEGKDWREILSAYYTGIEFGGADAVEMV